MRLSGESIKKFMAVYEKKFGNKISKQEAMESAHKLVRLVKIVYGHEAKNRNRSKTSNKNLTKM
ncbi:hypothetical protein EPN15_04990 [Patescibacteria group bacterium]|nr:MAG: hypothetical protein EPN15_04990 [Patescibacteria group bacterium]